MNIPTITGVRYVGKKDRQEDTVCKTGAVWKPGQVHNFSEDIAKRLLVHTDSFERADISMSGGTFMSRGGDAGRAKNHDVAAFVNLTGMGTAQLAHFARLNFGRQITTDGKDEDQIRRDVHTLMINANLDDEALRREDEATNDGRISVPYMATAEEYAALNDGTVKLALVPAEIMLADAEPTSGEAEGSDGDTGDASKKPDGDGDAGEAGQPPTLTELLQTLEKPQLMDFARQEGISFSNNIPADKLREKIFAELSAREITKGA